MKHDSPPTQSLERNVGAIAKVESAVLGERSQGERLSRYLIRHIGTPASVALHSVLFVGWIFWNSGLLPPRLMFDHFPFNLLGTIASLEAIILGVLILASQNRLQHEADRRAHLHLQINMMAEAEGTKMLQMLDALCRRFDIDSQSGDLLAELKQETDPEAIVESIKNTMPVEE